MTPNLPEPVRAVWEGFPTLTDHIAGYGRVLGSWVSQLCIR